MVGPRGYVDIRVVGDTRGVEAMLHRLDTALNPSAIAGFLGAEVTPYIEQRAGARFSGEGDDVVGAWSPLKPATQEIRQQQGFGSSHPINRRTGELEQYIVGAPHAITITPAGATLTSPGNPASGELLDKVETAQQGRQYPNTVARPVLGLNEQDMSVILTALAMSIKNIQVSS